MSWLSNFFKKDIVKALFKIIEKIFISAAGRAANKLQEIAMEEVKRQEDTGKDGLDKFQHAFKNIKNRFPEVKDGFIETAIQNAWLALEVYKK